MQTMGMPTEGETIDARRLLDVLDAYFAAKGPTVSELTLRNYREQIRPFTSWFAAYCADGQLNRTRIADWVRWMRFDMRTTRGGRPAENTIAHAISRFKGFALWAYQNGATGSVNLAEWVPFLRKRGSRLYFPSLAEMQRLFDATEGRDRVRDLAIFAVLLATGARRYEVASAAIDNTRWNTPLEDVALNHDHGGWIHLYRVKFDREGLGTGRPVVFDSATGLLLKVWLRTSGRAGAETLFGVTDSALSQMVRRRGRRAGLPDMSPHAFRRCFADHWQEHNGMEGAGALKLQLGHSLAGDVTQRHYVDQHNTRRVVAEIQRRYVSPVEGLHIDWHGLPVHIG